MRKAVSVADSCRGYHRATHGIASDGVVRRQDDGVDAERRGHEQAIEGIAVVEGKLARAVHVFAAQCEAFQ